MGRKKSAAKKAREAELKLSKEVNPEGASINQDEKKRKFIDEDDSERDSDEDDESSTSEEEDDFGDLLTNDVEQGINQVLNAIKTGDKSLFDSNVKFFKEEDDSNSAVKEKKEKPIYLKDYQRMNLLDGHAFEDDDGEERDWKNEEKPYAMQQKEDKDKLLAAFNDDEDNDDDFLVKKEKKPEDETKEKDDELPDPEIHGENFLEAYMNKRAWIPTKNSKEVDLEEDDDEFDDAVEEFEHAYNFRFEDPEAASIVSYARSQATMRREKTNSRKKERQKKQDDYKKDKLEKDELLKKKKQKKVNQVMDRINEIKRAVGDEVPEEVIMRVFGESLLKDDFDDSEWDSKMAEIFDDEYYTNEISKPEWDEDDEIMAEFNEKKKKELEEDDDEDDDEEEVSEEKADEEEVSEEKADENGPAEQKSKKAKKKEAKHEKKSKKAKVKEAAEKIVNSNSLQLLDEVEEERGRKKSKDEDIRFKYREVSPESFGLTTREILLAEDVDLNEFIGIKKFAPYREKQAQLKDKRKYAKKKRLRDWRMRVFDSADGPKVEEGEEDIIKIPSIVNKGSHKHKSHKQKFKKRKTEN